MFSVIGSVMTEPTDGGAHAGVFDPDPDDPGAEGSSAARDPEGIELILHPPPLPGCSGDPHTGGVPGRSRRIDVAQGEEGDLRQRNADISMELVRSTGWGHAQVNRELNRLAGIERIGDATLAELERRLAEARSWLRRA